jgi:hypothetical protein
LRALCQKNENEIASLAKDKKKLWSEFKSFASAQILEEAKEAILPELSEKGKEALSDVSPENEVSLKFESLHGVVRRDKYG